MLMLTRIIVLRQQRHLPHLHPSQLLDMLDLAAQHAVTCCNYTHHAHRCSQAPSGRRYSTYPAAVGRASKVRQEARLTGQMLPDTIWN